MSSPGSTAPDTPSRRSTRNAPSGPGSPSSVASSRQSSRRGEKKTREDAMDTSDHDMSDLARPLPPSSPIKSPSSVSVTSSAKKSKRGVPAPYVDNQPAGGPGSVLGGPASNYGGPGSVLVSEIDLSSPLNYGTPSSMGSSTFRTPGAVGVRGTPIRIRSDIQSERRLRQVNVASPAPATPEPRSSRGQPSGLAVPQSEGSIVPGSENSAEANPQLVIWGTDVSVAACKAKFKKFLETFIDPEVDEDEKLDGLNPEEPLYLQKLEQVH